MPSTPAHLPFELPQLSLGTMTFGGQVDRDTTARIVDDAVAAGVTFIDTANVYVGGESEAVLGDLLHDRRDSVILASKVGSPTGADGPRLDPATMRDELTGSLARLRTDHLDLYYLHRPDRSIPLEESLGALEELRTEGLIRASGTSNYPAWQMTRAHDLAVSNGWQPPEVAQPIYNLLARRIEDEHVEATNEFGIANVVYNPLAGGLLTGKYRADQPPGEDNRFGHEQFRSQYQDRYWNRAQFDAVEALQAIATDAGLPMVELALRWLVSKPHVASIVLGVSRPEQLAENVAAVERGPLPEDVLQACDATREIAHGPAPSHIK